MGDDLSIQWILLNTKESNEGNRKTVRHSNDCCGELFLSSSAALTISALPADHASALVLQCSSAFRATRGIIQRHLGRRFDCVRPVSYTHLDVYKRQVNSRSPPAPVEKPFFNLVVIFHSFMVIQMILAQIGKTAVINLNLINSSLIDTMGGYFHYALPDICLLYTSCSSISAPI